MSADEPSAPSAEPSGPTNVARAAAHAERLGKPRIGQVNAAEYKPPSLNKLVNKFRGAERRAPDDCDPAIWYWQMTGCDWDRSGPDHAGSFAPIRLARRRAGSMRLAAE